MKKSKFTKLKTKPPELKGTYEITGTPKWGGAYLSWAYWDGSKFYNRNDKTTALTSVLKWRKCEESPIN